MMKLRIGFASTLALAFAMTTLPALAQDGAKKGPRKTAPRARPGRAQKPKTPKPKPPTKAETEAEEDSPENAPPEDPKASEADEGSASEGSASEGSASEGSASEAGAEVEEEGTGNGEDPKASEAEAAENPDDAESGGGDSGDASDASDAESETEIEKEPSDAAPTKTRKKRRKRRTSKRRRTKRQTPKRSKPADDRPLELEYFEGMDVPEDYMLVERSRKGLMIAGAITFGVGWLASATAAVAASDEEHGCFGGGYGHGDREDRTAVYHEFDDWCGGHDAEDFAPLYIPIVGPFIAMGTLDNAGGGVRAALLLDGVVQVGGAAMFIAGLAAKKTSLIRTKHATVDIAPGPGSVMFTGTF